MPPPVEEVSFELIRQVQLKESRSSTLTKLPADFYEQLAAHLERLKATAREEVARDPMSARATLAQNELRSTLQLARDITMLRLRKLANRTVDALEGGRIDVHGLIPIEKEIYDRLAPFMARARDGLLPSERAQGAPAPAAGSSQAAGDEGAAPPAVMDIPTTAAPSVPLEEPAPPAPAAAGTSAASPHPAPPPPAAPTAAQRRPAPPPRGTQAAAQQPQQQLRDDIVVHVLKDTPPFAGEGGASYALRTGDIVNLPRRLAELLVQRGVAETVEVAPPAQPGRPSGQTNLG
jgi:DNA replication initiation complex subunit (GINS family)